MNTGCNADTRITVIKLLLLVASLLIAGASSRSEAEWSGGVEGGTVVDSSGNQTRLRLTLSNNARPFSQYIYAEWLSGNNGEDGYAVGYNPRYWLTDTYYVFGESKYRVDKAFDIDQEIRLLAGLGGQFINSDEQGLYVELGLGSTSIEFTSQSETSQGLGLARLGYFRQVADIVKLDLELYGSRSEDELTEFNSEAGISLRIPGGAIRYAYRTRSIRIADEDRVSVSDSFVSYTYGF